EALAIEAVLVALLVAGHGEVALVGILVGTAPGVVDAHRVVGGDGAVEERPARLAGVLGAELVEGVDVLPEFEDRPLLGGEIDLRFNLLKRHEEPHRGGRLISLERAETKGYRRGISESLAFG